MYNPLISIIIPVYNGANYLKQAIDSALNQTYSNIEIIVVNDGSNDNGATEKIALSYGNKLRYFFKENGGSSSALNYGISVMEGEWFSWLSHDDLYTPDKIKSQMEMINDNMEVKEKLVLKCSSELIRYDGSEIRRVNKSLSGRFTGFDMFQKFHQGYGINGCTLLISKKILDKNGFFNEKLRYLNDIEYWYNLMLSESIFICTDKIYVKMRIHDEQVSKKIPEAFYKEKEIISLDFAKKMCTNYEKYISYIRVFVAACKKENNNAAYKYLMNKMKQNNDWKFIDDLKMVYYRLYGKGISFLKRMYAKYFKK